MGWNREQIEVFLYREARLIDEHRYDEWLSLWTDDGVYWVPCNEDDSTLSANWRDARLNVE
jgi:benzoate/toluate 1,2-dioxygenase beta subunit